MDKTFRIMRLMHENLVFNRLCAFISGQDCLKFFTDIGNTKTTQIFKEECRDKASSQIDEGREV